VSGRSAAVADYVGNLLWLRKLGRQMVEAAVRPGQEEPNGRLHQDLVRR